VTPQIAAEGTSIFLKISIESSQVLPNSVSKVDITTAKRTITTNVLIDDGGVVVLGGLISNNHTQSGQRVPLLGSIPIIGNLFRTRAAESQKNNLMMFIRPKILRDEQQAAYQTESKYNYMMDQQKRYNKGQFEIPLLPGVKKPKLDPMPPTPPPSAAPAPASPDERAKRAKDQEQYDADQLKKLQQQPPKSGSPPSGKSSGSQPPYGTPPDAAVSHPDGEPPYATEKPGVLIPPAPPPPSPTPPEGGKP
jgi:Flp pilus assembly secretin CpaC